MRCHLIVYFLVFVILLFVGCSKAEDPATPVLLIDEFSSDRSESVYSNNRYLWGIWEFRYDAESGSFEILPDRTAMDYWNVRGFLEGWPCEHCLAITRVEPTTHDSLEVDVRITHPFDSLNFTGFDVRGIAMFEGSREFPELEVTMPDYHAGTGEVLNPDGWTTLMAPWTIDAGAPPIQGYSSGRFAGPTEPSATVNAYKRYISDYPDNTRNAFYAGDEITQRYDINMPDGDFVFGYAVAACWAPPENKPVEDPMTDFGALASAFEPYRIDVTQAPIGQGLRETGGAVLVTLGIYDYTPASYQAPQLECPEIFDGAITAAWEHTDFTMATYTALITNDKLADPGSYDCMIRVIDDENSYFPDWIDVSAYQVFTLEVHEDDLTGWAKTWGSADETNAYDVAADELGNVYVVGRFEGTVDFDPGDGVDNHTSNGETDCFLSRFDAAGEHIWTHTWGSIDGDRALGVAVGGMDYIYVVGEFLGEVDFDPDPDDEWYGTPEFGQDGFISRFRSNGEWVWTRLISGMGWNSAQAVAVDSFGNAYACGSFEHGTKFAQSDTTHESNGTGDAWVAQYIANDFMIGWVGTWGGAAYDSAHDVAIDGSGNVIVTGYFGDEVDLDPGDGTDTHTSWGNTDAFLSKFDSAGEYQWGRHWGGTNADSGDAVDATSDGAVYVAGRFFETIDIDPGGGEYWLASHGMVDAFICRYDSSGTFDWAQCVGGEESDGVETITTDSAGDVVMAGHFRGSVDFDPGLETDTRAAIGDLDIFVIKLLSTSGYVWGRNIGDAGSDVCYGVDIGESSFIYTAGYFSGTVDFAPRLSPPDEHTANGIRDAFLMKYLSDGNWE